MNVETFFRNLPPERVPWVEMGIRIRKGGWMGAEPEYVGMLEFFFLQPWEEWSEVITWFLYILKCIPAWFYRKSYIALRAFFGIVLWHDQDFDISLSFPKKKGNRGKISAEKWEENRRKRKEHRGKWEEKTYHFGGRSSHKGWFDATSNRWKATVSGFSNQHFFLEV